MCRSNQTIDKMNNIIRAIALAEHCGFIDNNYQNGSTCNEPGINILTNPNDGRARFLHLKPEAQQAFGFRIAEYINLQTAVLPPAIVSGPFDRLIGGNENQSGTRSHRPRHPRKNQYKRRWWAQWSM